MAPHRIYPLAADNHIFAPPHDVECASDQAAADEAATLIGDHPAIEVWNGTRLVGRLTALECRARRGERAPH